MGKVRLLSQLRAWLVSLFRRGTDSENVLALIDFHDHRRGGHFGPWLYWFASEFSKRFDEVVILTPIPKTTRRLFEGQGGSPARNISFARFPKRFQKKFDLDVLLRGIRRGSRRTAAFIMWGYDLCDCESLKPTKYPWSTLFGISWLARRAHSRDTEKEKRLVEIVAKDDSCKAFFQPDYFLKNRHEKGVWVTDVEGISLSREQTPLLRSIREFGSNPLCVGAFGMLHGYRCVDEVILLGREQPDVKFVLAGKIFYEGVREDLRGDLEPGRRKNLFIYPNFIESEDELNAAIRSVDGIFIDGCHYPVQSGIVCRALHFGRWILSSTGDSWTNDVIRDGGVGFTYPTRDSELIKVWERWKARGGEQRSFEYSMRLRDPLTVNECFDVMTKRLLKGDIMP